MFTTTWGNTKQETLRLFSLSSEMGIEDDYRSLPNLDTETEEKITLLSLREKEAEGIDQRKNALKCFAGTTRKMGGAVNVH